MWITLILVAILTLLLILRLAKWYLVDLKCYPPGPLPLPFYGNIIPRDVHPGLCEWHSSLRKKYGNVFTIHQGAVANIIVNGYEAVMEVLHPNNRELVVQTRATGCGILSLLHEDKGLVWNDELFKQLRRISVESIKLYNEKSSLNDAGTISNLKLQDWLATKNMNGEPVDVTEPLRDLVSYNICAMLFGEMNKKTDEGRFRTAIGLHYQSLINNTALDAAQKLPMVKIFPLLNNAWTEFNHRKTQFQSFITQEIRNHTKNMNDLSDISNDFIDVFIRSRAKSKLTDKDCQATIMQLMLAGLDAVHGTLMWLILYCVKFPDVQHKIQKELDHHSETGDWQMGTNLCTTLPYCNAVINEVLRISNVAFTTLPYRNTQEMTVSGLQIPANSSIVINLTSVHQDQKLYPEPNKFKPERFLDDEGKLIKFKHFMPFSTGRRACIGESFTRRTILQVLSSLLTAYRVEKVAGETYSTETCKSFLSIPKAYKVKVSQRQL